MRAHFALIAVLASQPGLAEELGSTRLDTPSVHVERVPAGGIQPHVRRDADGSLHLVYFVGSAKGGNLTYEHRTEEPGDRLRVNSERNTAVAMGTIRGAQFALTEDGTVHVVWNGARREGASQSPDAVYYTRLPTGQGSFEPQRNLMRNSFHLDGGANIAAHGTEQVVVSWHAAPTEESMSAQDRRIFVARSEDGGQKFEGEKEVYGKKSGACECCGLTSGFTTKGTFLILFRSATKKDRGMWALTASRGFKSFKGKAVDRWSIQTCPMSSAAIVSQASGSVTAWENDGQIFLGSLEPSSGKISRVKAAPGKGTGRKHPRVAVNLEGQICMVWTVGTGWNQGGTVAWQVFSSKGSPLRSASGSETGLPAWSFPAVWADDTGDFHVMY